MGNLLEKISEWSPTVGHWLKVLSEWGPVAWLLQYKLILWWVAATSVALGVVVVIALPWLVCLIPEDYFATKERKKIERFGRHPALFWSLRIGKSLFGIFLLILGGLLGPLPGQGTLTAIIGLVLIEFPGKRRLEMWLIRRPGVLRTLNWLRTWGKRPPLEVWQPGMPEKPETPSPAEASPPEQQVSPQQISPQGEETSNQKQQREASHAGR